MCPDLTKPTNGIVTMTGNSVGDTATYSCETGYVVVGVETLACEDDGAWSDPPPVCVSVVGMTNNKLGFKANKNLCGVLVIVIVT